LSETFSYFGENDRRTTRELDSELQGSGTNACDLPKILSSTLETHLQTVCVILLLQINDFEKLYKFFTFSVNHLNC